MYIKSLFNGKNKYMCIGILYTSRKYCILINNFLFWGGEFKFSKYEYYLFLSLLVLMKGIYYRVPITWLAFFWKPQKFEYVN